MKKIAKRGYSYNAKHFLAIASFIDQIIAGKVNRARIHMPPRHGKTETVTKGLALWYLKHRPGCRILITGYSQRFAEKLSRDIRNLAREQGIQLAQDKFASNEWFTTENSMVMARGTGNVPTGEGFDLIIVDDPTRDAQQASSALFRDTAWDWFTQGLMTRIQPDGVVICIWTRWNEDDIAGRSDELAKEEPDATSGRFYCSRLKQKQAIR